MKQFNPIVGILGKKGHGKDTVGAMVAEQTGWELDSFAAPLRKFSYEMFGISHETYNAVISGLGMTGRQFLQEVGTRVMREIDSDQWIRALAHRLKSSGNRGRLILTDVRFPNEVQFVKANGGLLLHVVRPDRHDTDSHISESGVSTSLVDYSICNCGDVLELQKKVEKFVWWCNGNTKAADSDLPFFWTVK